MEAPLLLEVMELEAEWALVPASEAQGNCCYTKDVAGGLQATFANRMEVHWVVETAAAAVVAAAVAASVVE